MGPQKATTRRAPSGANEESSTGLSAEERAALKERVEELKGEGRRGKTNKGNGEGDVLSKIAEMTGSDRAMAERLHELIREVAPELTPKSWYGMPAYARDGKVVCFFQSAQKFKTRYATLGFTDGANLDEGDVWPVAFALKKLSAAEEKKIAKLVKKAVN